MKIALNSIDEAALVNRCKENDPAAQKILYDRYVEILMILSLRYVINHEDAKEVVMDGFLNCFKHINGFTYLGEGSLKAWLKKIVVNQCLMHLRKRKPIVASGKETEHFDVADNNENALDYLNAKEIMKLVHTLPDGYRTIFNLYFFEGMNHKEISELLTISEGTSKSQLHRARNFLKEKILQTNQHIYET